MMLDLYNICPGKLAKSGIFNNTGVEDVMFTMEEYNTLAKRFIAVYGGGPLMLNDPEATDYVVQGLMMGSCRWFTEQRGSHRGYLAQCAKWAITRWKCTRYKGRKKHIDSTSLSDDVYHDGRMRVSDIIEDTQDDRHENEELRQYAYEIIDQTNLTERERFCVDKVYREGCTLQEVGDELGLTRERVRQITQRAVSKMREMVGVE